MAGVEGKPVVFLLTDTQISKESFLEDVNNLLNTGDVPGLFAPEDKERIIGSIREWLLSQGAPTNKVPNMYPSVLELLLQMHSALSRACASLFRAVGPHHIAAVRAEGHSTYHN